MKSALLYYYNLNSCDIHQIGNVYKFTADNNYYVLSPCNIDTINQIYDIYLLFLENGVYTHRILLNRENQIVTNIDNSGYVLMQLYDEMSRKVTLNDIINFTVITSKFNLQKFSYSNWANLWANKIDYFEYQINQFGQKYPLIRESFGYFSGIVENGISLFRIVDLDEARLSICHNRIKSDSTVYDLYNPLNFTVDFQIRDICEYVKDCFWKNINCDVFPLLYIFNSTEKILFFIRLFYPSFYFDCYELIIKGEKDESVLSKIIDNTKNYDIFLKKNYFKLQQIIYLPDIEWLKK